MPQKIFTKTEKGNSSVFTCPGGGESKEAAGVAESDPVVCGEVSLVPAATGQAGQSMPLSRGQHAHL